MLKVSNLHAAYGTVPVLTGVELELGKGEILALLGRNGVEKVIEMQLNDEEKAMLDHSAEAVRSVVEVLGY